MNGQMIVTRALQERDGPRRRLPNWAGGYGHQILAVRVLDGRYPHGSVQNQSLTAAGATSLSAGTGAPVVRRKLASCCAHNDDLRRAGIDYPQRGAEVLERLAATS